MDMRKTCDQKKYAKWTVELILRNRERAREVYYLLTDFLGETNCSKSILKGEPSGMGNDTECDNQISDNAMLYKISILELLDAVGEGEREIVFLRQIYTIMKRHVEKEKNL